VLSYSANSAHLFVGSRRESRQRRHLPGEAIFLRGQIDNDDFTAEGAFGQARRRRRGDPCPAARPRSRSRRRKIGWTTRLTQTRAAVEEGVLPGGGVPLLRTIRASKTLRLRIPHYPQKKETYQFFKGATARVVSCSIIKWRAGRLPPACVLALAPAQFRVFPHRKLFEKPGARARRCEDRRA
jgi:hypothetical protein